jgi:methylmalonyl-CoA mutase cobalamin-binding subunit
MSPGQEHLATAVIRRVLESLASAAMPGPDAPGIVIATPSGQVHEFGALFVAAAAATRGWRVTYLGTSLPAADIAEIARDTSASAIAVSLVYPEDDPAVKDDLVRLRAAAGATLPILVGGRAVPSYRKAVDAIDGRIVNNLGELSATLEAITAPGD